MTSPEPETTPSTAPRKPGLKRMWRLAPASARVLVISLAAVALLGVVGTAIATGVAVQNYSNWKVVDDRSIERYNTIAKLEDDLSRAEADAARAESNLVPQEELRQREQAVAEKETLISQRESNVKGREDAIIAKEQYVQMTSLPDGTYTVGVSMEPGTYRVESTNTRCYWAIYTSGTNYDDIVQNDAGSTGVLTVTVGAGQDFRTLRCGTWSKVG